MQSIIAGAVVGAMLFIALLLAPTTVHAEYCQPTLVDDMSNAQIADRTSQGWHGDPDDHMEALYPPEC